ncbi:FG-GAP repeat domain-containing protein, partial [Mesorhizobium japonicum]|uniref:FG-GAP repeat domain-containing protein n=1 Tax=Mesorhizobium japonicum TaxID=2066070 RepID=UPI003B5B32DA
MDLFLGQGRNAANTADVIESRIYWNNQIGGFGTASGTTGGSATYFSDTVPGGNSLAVDWNHDGRMDVIELLRSGTGASALYLNQGGGVFVAGTVVSTSVAYVGASLWDFNWDGAQDVVFVRDTAVQPFFNNNLVADGTSLHLQVFDQGGRNVFYANTVQLFNSAGVLVSSQIINSQSGISGNDNSAMVYFYGLSSSETYTVVLLKSLSGVSS